jgi:hypothetical protein
MDVELLLVFGRDGGAQPPEDGEEEGHLEGRALHLTTSSLPSDNVTDSFLAKPNHDILNDLILMNLAFYEQKTTLTLKNNSLRFLLLTATF